MTRWLGNAFRIAGTLWGENRWIPPRRDSNTALLIITIGECGQIPPSVVCHTNVIKYMHRIKDMNDHHIVKQVYNELSRLHELGFTTWCSRVWKVVQQYNIDIFHNDGNFKTYCQSSIENKFIQNWEFDVQNVEKNPILRTYAKIKTTFGIEKYGDSVRNFRYRNAITKIRTSSHSLEIEKGRHRKNGNKIPACQRLCQNCNVVEDEIHFVMDCTINLSERRTLFNNITADSSPFENLDRMSKFKYLFSTEMHNTWHGWENFYIHVLVNVSTNNVQTIFTVQFPS